MELSLFSVFDRKASAFMRPFAMPTSGMAIRMFEEMCGDQTSQFYKFPGDFVLHAIGTFDEASGRVKAYQNTMPLSNASDFRAGVVPVVPAVEGEARG